MSQLKLSKTGPAEATPSDTRDETFESTSTTDETIEEQTELSKDLIFELLKESRRRLVLKYLNEHGGESTLGEMAEYIAAEENDCDQSQISSDQRKRAYVALYQCHLSKMDDSNVIDFDRPRGDIELRDEADELLSYLCLDRSDNESTAVIPFISAVMRDIRSKMLVIRRYLFQN